MAIIIAFIAFIGSDYSILIAFLNIIKRSFNRDLISLLATYYNI
jgi:hypothetical protein